MKRTPALGSTLAGIDVSHYDTVIDWAKVKKQNIVFAMAKCTENNVDGTFTRNREGAKGQGILFCGYHFFHPSHDPNVQADLYLKNAKPQKGELIPMLDWETTDNVPSQTDVARAKVWLDRVEKACGRKPMIYTGPFFMDAMSKFLTKDFADYPLFIAHYGTMSPLVPAPWSNWAFHQYTEKGNLAGFQAGVHEDLDRFNGTMSDLQKLVL